MYPFGDAPDRPLADIPEHELDEAYSRCRQALLKIQYLGFWFSELLICAKTDYGSSTGPPDTEECDIPIYLGDLDEIAASWMKSLTEISELYPPYSHDVGLLIEKANTAYDTRTSLTLPTGLRPKSRDFPTAHAAVAAALNEFIRWLKFDDVHTAKKFLPTEGFRMRREWCLANFKRFDTDRLMCDLSMEHRHACKWLHEQSDGKSEIDSITFAEIAELLGRTLKRVQNAASKWRKVQPIGETCSYKIVRPFLIETWGKRAEAVFPPSYEEMRESLRNRRTDGHSSKSV